MSKKVHRSDGCIGSCDIIYIVKGVAVLAEVYRDDRMSSGLGWFAIYMCCLPHALCIGK